MYNFERVGELKASSQICSESDVATSTKKFCTSKFINIVAWMEIYNLAT